MKAHGVISSTDALSRIAGGITASTRYELEMLHRGFRGPFTIGEAARALKVDEADARRRLGYLSRRGWLTRVRRGLYLAVPLESPRSGEWTEDPWIVAVKAFSPCYIGGWSACEHWDLTEQIFRDVVIVTAREVRTRHVQLQTMPFVVTARPADRLFGTRSVWRRDVRVLVSDPSRTIIDVLDDPSLGGGIRHIYGVVREYIGSQHRDDTRLLEYGDRLGNRTVFKRLGWLLEILGVDAPLRGACLARRSSGLTKLDPTVSDTGRIVRRWNLRVNVDLPTGEDHW